MISPLGDFSNRFWTRSCLRPRGTGTSSSSGARWPADCWDDNCTSDDDDKVKEEEEGYCWFVAVVGDQNTCLVRVKSWAEALVLKRLEKLEFWKYLKMLAWCARCRKKSWAETFVLKILNFENTCLVCSVRVKSWAEAFVLKGQLEFWVTGDLTIVSWPCLYKREKIISMRTLIIRWLSAKVISWV